MDQLKQLTWDIHSEETIASLTKYRGHQKVI